MNAQTNWRVLALPSVTPVPSESASILGKTALFEMNGSGEAQNIVISQEEPTWSINFKKALVSLFVTKVAENKAQLETNTVVST